MKVVTQEEESIPVAAYLLQRYCFSHLEMWLDLVPSTQKESLVWDIFYLVYPHTGSEI